MGRSSQPVMGRPVFVSCGISVAMVNKEIGVWSMQGDGAGLTYFKFGSVQDSVSGITLH